MASENSSQTLQKAIRAARRGKHDAARQLLTDITTAEPDNESAWLWLAQVTDGRPSEKQTALENVLRLNPENKWAEQQLAEIATAPAGGAAGQTAGAGTADPLSDLQQVEQPSRPEKMFGELSVTELSCPNCTSPLNIHGSDIKTVVCDSCNSVVDLAADHPEVVDQLKRQPRPPHNIKPGDMAMFNNKKHQVIGWLRYKGWDDEDTWYWTEWLMAVEDGSYRWLSYDTEAGFVLWRRLPVTKQFDPQSGFPVDGVTVSERAPARITALAGEMTWRAKVGDRMRYIDAAKGNRKYSVEMTADEIELTEGIPLKPEQLWTAFGREEKAAEVAQKQDRRGFMTRIAQMLFIFAAVSFCSFCGTYATGEQLLDESVRLSQESPTARFGPIQMDEVERPHQVDLTTTGFSVDNWAVVDMSIEGPDGRVYYLFGTEFWDEDGYDEGEYWHESQYENTGYFRPELEGPHEIVVTLDDATISSLNVRVRIQEGVWMGRFFLILTILLGAAAFFARGRANSIRTH